MRLSVAILAGKMLPAPDLNRGLLYGKYLGLFSEKDFGLRPGLGKQIGLPVRLKGFIRSPVTVREVYFGLVIVLPQLQVQATRKLPYLVAGLPEQG